MIDLTDPSATGVREVLHSHAHDVATPPADLASRAERRAATLRRRRAAQLSGGVAVVLAAAIAIPLSLSGSAGAGSRIKQQPPLSSAVPTAVTAPTVVDNDPTTWPFRGDPAVSRALTAVAKGQVDLKGDRTADYTVRPLYAGTDMYGDRFLAFLGLPADPSKSIAFAVYQQTPSGTGFLMQPYDIGAAGSLDVRVLDLAMRTGSLRFIPVVAAPDVAAIHDHVLDGPTTTDEDCKATHGVAICVGADVTTDQIQVLGTSGAVIAVDHVHYDQAH